MAAAILRNAIINLVFSFSAFIIFNFRLVFIKCPFMRLTLSDYSACCLLLFAYCVFLIRSIHTLDSVDKDTSFNFKTFNAQCSTGFVVFIIYICCIFLRFVGRGFIVPCLYLFLFRISFEFLRISYEH